VLRCSGLCEPATWMKPEEYTEAYCSNSLFMLEFWKGLVHLTESHHKSSYEEIKLSKVNLCDIARWSIALPLTHSELMIAEFMYLSSYAEAFLVIFDSGLVLA